MLEKNIKEGIIRFVIDSPEEENSKVATFIAGMQAQRDIQGDKRGETPENADIRPELGGGTASP
jgi:hypothetical protein